MNNATHKLRRGFVDVQDGQMHYWESGKGSVPLILLHPSPGAGRMLLPLLTHLAKHRRVIALDTRGNGDSSPLTIANPTIFDFAQSTLEAANAMGITEFDLFGSHTGASIAMETAILAPTQVRKLILDGMGLWNNAVREEHLAKNAPVIEPDLMGSQFNWAWHYCRDQYLFWPWYDRSSSAVIPGGLPDAATLHEFVVEVLKALGTYHMSYRAAASHPKRDRLPLIRTPTLVTCAEDDPLFRYLPEMRQLVAGSECRWVKASKTPEGLAEAAQIYTEFLN
ncbi:MAG: alpha/beta hydrolase [Steroidobacteraceae bacterium]